MVGIQERDTRPEGISDFQASAAVRADLSATGTGARQHSLMRATFANVARVPLDVTMEHYVHRENIVLHQRLAGRDEHPKDQARHTMLMELGLPK